VPASSLLGLGILHVDQLVIGTVRLGSKRDRRQIPAQPSADLCGRFWVGASWTPPQLHEECSECNENQSSIAYQALIG
jgi:hypothetical protein